MIRRIGIGTPSSHGNTYLTANLPFGINGLNGPVFGRRLIRPQHDHFVPEGTSPGGASFLPWTVPACSAPFVFRYCRRKDEP